MERRTLIATIAVLGMWVGHQSSHAQLLNKIKNRVQETAENRAVNKAGDATEKGLDEAEEGLGGKKNKKQGDTEAKQEEANVPATRSAVDGSGTLTLYANYDFVPGDRLIYFYDMVGEADAEIPGRMLLNSGNAEIQTYQGEKVLIAPAGGEPYMTPYMAEDSYLPSSLL